VLVMVVVWEGGIVHSLRHLLLSVLASTLHSRGKFLAKWKGEGDSHPFKTKPKNPTSLLKRPQGSGYMGETGADQQVGASPAFPRSQ